MTSALVIVAVPFLLWRRASARDIHNGIFLGMFGLMQILDAGHWANERWGGAVLQPGPAAVQTCPGWNRSLTVVGGTVIMLEPWACLVGRMVAAKRWASLKEFAAYVVAFVLTPWACLFVGTLPDGCQGTDACTMLSYDGHLLYSPGVDSSGNVGCWRKHVVFGEASTEIPLLLRVFFLAGMVYPYLSRDTRPPMAAGMLQSAVLITTWLYGLMSGGHASMWCVANVAQILTMVADPYLFGVRISGSPVEHGKRNPNIQDRFSKSKIPDSLDAIVIGSGAGGLATAAILAKAGRKVLVLEQHYRAGGCTHTFDEFGNLFDSGIHYVGGGQGTMKRLLSWITDAPGVRLAPMGTAKDNYLYDEFDLGDGTGEGEMEHLIRYRGLNDDGAAVLQELRTRFPHQVEAINAFDKKSRECSQSFHAFAASRLLPDWALNLFGGALRKFLRRRLMKSAGVTATQAVESCGITDLKLKALLTAGQLIDWNLIPRECSWLVIGGMLRYYSDGGFYPEGGSQVFAERIIPVIERHGGRVLCRANVDKVIINEKGEACGVRLKTHKGLEIHAPLVVSSVGCTNTWGKLVPEEALAAHSLQPQPPQCPPASNGHMTAFVNLDGPPQDFDLRAANMHSWLGLPRFGFDPSKMQETFYNDPLPNAHDCLVTLTSPSAKDAKYGDMYPGTSNMLLLTEAKYEWFLPGGVACSSASCGEHGHRAEEYKAFKSKWEDVFLQRLYRYYPKTRGHVTSIEIGTPLSSEHYIAADRGGSYGLAWTVERFNESLLNDYCAPVTKIPNLFMSGEAVLFGGFVGATVGGYIAALKILGWPRFLWTLLTSDVVDADRCHLEGDDGDCPSFSFLKPLAIIFGPLALGLLWSSFAIPSVAAPALMVLSQIAAYSVCSTCQRLGERSNVEVNKVKRA